MLMRSLGLTNWTVHFGAGHAFFTTRAVVAAQWIGEPVAKLVPVTMETAVTRNKGGAIVRHGVTGDGV